MKEWKDETVCKWGMAIALAAILITLLSTCGCGVWVEIEHDPATGAISVLYENRRPFAPENATVKTTAEGWEVTMGEQATQNAVAGKLTDAIVVLSGAATP